MTYVNISIPITLNIAADGEVTVEVDDQQNTAADDDNETAPPPSPRRNIVFASSRDEALAFAQKTGLDQRVTKLFWHASQFRGMTLTPDDTVYVIGDETLTDELREAIDIAKSRYTD